MMADELEARADDLQRDQAKLPIGNRQVILLIALEDLSYEEAAEALRIPVGTVRSRLPAAARNCDD
jgi:RNA polymerase sigma-70 factor (ECF subfamily)